MFFKENKFKIERNNLFEQAFISSGLDYTICSGKSEEKEEVSIETAIKNIDKTHVFDIVELNYYS